MRRIIIHFLSFGHADTLKTSLSQGTFIALITTASLILCQLFNEQLRNSNRLVRKTYVSPEPIDLVYTWVNGSNEQFRESIAHFSPVVDESRYNDKNELKYSLRSVEKYAPWIRHIYIVTNGQIPHWLDVHNTRISIVTHDEISPPELRSEILPTFSSFAIETLLHRIPNLSQRFIYFNDDVFLGAPLYLDHLITESEGIKIWTAWHLPDCSELCQWTFIGDGTCDLNCYTELCHFDGGDCDGRRGSGDVDEKGFALVDDSRVRKIVVGVNGEIADDYRFSDVPKVKVPRRMSSSSSGLNGSKAPLDADGLPQNETIESTTSLSVKETTEQSIAKRIAYNLARTHFLDSLVYSNYILNRRYGFKERRVIAHVGFLLDKTIMKAMINTFAKEFNQTRYYRLRYGRESIQLSFFYYNFLMSEMRSKSNTEIFNEIDRDRSGAWNAREIRALLMRIFPYPLTKESMDNFRDIVARCPYIQPYQHFNLSIDKGLAKYQIDSNLPTHLSRETVTQCEKLMNTIRDRYRVSMPKYTFKRHTRVGDESHFVMLLSNRTNVKYHLDHIIRRPKLFNCINDDLSHIDRYASENRAIMEQLSEFYLTLFPNRSQFEMEDVEANGFRYMSEYREWMANERRDWQIAAFFIGNLILIYLFCRTVEHQFSHYN